MSSEQNKVIDPLQEKVVPNPTGGVVEKTEKPIPAPTYPGPPQSVDPQLVVPEARTDEEISLEHESDRLDDVMRKNRMSDERLAESQEPQFIEALEAKQQAQQKVAEAPAQYRQREEKVLSTVGAQADQSLTAELEGMTKVRGRSGAAVHKGQTNTETKTETRQREIKKTIDGISSKTATDVGTILSEMTEKVRGLRRLPERKDGHLQ